MYYARKLTYILPVVIAVLVILVGASSTASAATGGSEEAGDISWVLLASVLVFLMIPGLAIFYGGLLRKESMISILVQTTMVVVASAFVWIVCGYSLAFSGGEGGVIGNLDFLFLDDLLDNVSANEDDSLLFAVFQMKFVMITTAIIIGACAERIKFRTISLIAILWTIIVYIPACHWVWGGGFLADNFTIVDYAGGTVVHTLAGASGLALALFAGRRAKKLKESQPHNIPLVYLGVFLLWFGWFGFNGGSGLNVEDGSAIRSFITTAGSAVAAALAWSVLEMHFTKKLTIIGMGTGILAGLVFITPMAAYVSISTSLVIGIIGGVICYVFYQIIHHKLKFDDALDVFAVHGIGGVFGTILTAFVVREKYGASVDGVLFGGDIDVLVGNVIAMVVCFVFAFVVTYAIAFVSNKLIPGKMSEEEQIRGQDDLEHSENAYN